MAFDALEVSIQLATALRAPLEALRRHDRDLAEQARRATTSVALNLAEGARRAGRDRLHCYRIAAGSAAEVHTALRVAVAWGYLDEATLRAALALLDRELAMCHRLTVPRPPRP